MASVIEKRQTELNCEQPIKLLRSASVTDIINVEP